jgi:hypothetical protein
MYYSSLQHIPVNKVGVSVAFAHAGKLTLADGGSLPFQTWTRSKHSSDLTATWGPRQRLADAVNPVRQVFGQTKTGFNDGNRCEVPELYCIPPRAYGSKFSGGIELTRGDTVRAQPLPVSISYTLATEVTMTKHGYRIHVETRSSGRSVVLAQQLSPILKLRSATPAARNNM